MQINCYLDLVRDTTLGQLISAGTMSQDYTSPRQSTLIIVTIITIWITSQILQAMLGISSGSKLAAEWTRKIELKVK